MRNLNKRFLNGICTVIIKETVKIDGETKMKDKFLLMNEPCHLSKKNISPATQTESKSSITNEYTLFISSTTDIPAGSKIIVNQYGSEYNLICSGRPFAYKTHKEIPVKENIDA